MEYKILPLCMMGEGWLRRVAKPWYIAPCFATFNVTVWPVRVISSAALKYTTLKLLSHPNKLLLKQMLSSLQVLETQSTSSQIVFWSTNLHNKQQLPNNHITFSNRNTGSCTSKTVFYRNEKLFSISSNIPINPLQTKLQRTTKTQPSHLASMLHLV